MTTYTPGPHVVEYQQHLGDPAYAIRAADGDLIAVGMLKGDADLFAAAPDLLLALQEMLSTHSMENIGVGASMRRVQAKEQARAAIARATGAGND